MQQVSAAVRQAEFKNLVPVRSLEDLGYMVKESEMLTGKPGRDFVVVGADRPAFHVELDAVGFQFVRLDANVDERTSVSARELTQHTLGNAMLCGMLYTEAIQ
ncbi:hypothetical protein [Piscinibacter gummiphilus]|uniref:Uncharacterized protein n=1 Tax=Piscinibacter gummiphilus TaxID=946333 RepID=A0ABZ0D1N0_9BURK|nr:hypothetical protein [Piscinibacter gummiphilus]WOB11154.1 hypothetical protein RXV79_27335 [Piscinibacter gummiphilus]